MNKIKLSFLSLAASFFLFSCGGGGTSNENAVNDNTVNESAVEESAVEESAAPEDAVVELSIEGNDQMQYNKKELRVKAGQTVKLTLTHVGTMPKAAMGHNFVLLKEGTDLNAFGQKAVAAADNDYIPASEEGNIIAHTKMLGGGESDTIEFEAPAKGTYEFLCSFPGHYAIMKGVFIVE